MLWSSQYKSGEIFSRQTNLKFNYLGLEDFEFLPEGFLINYLIWWFRHCDMGVLLLLGCLGQILVYNYNGHNHNQDFMKHFGLQYSKFGSLWNGEVSKPLNSVTNRCAEVIINKEHAIKD